MTTNQKATGSNPVGCTTKTLDELRAVEGFSFSIYPMKGSPPPCPSKKQKPVFPLSEAAQALGVQPGMIAKTMSFLQGDKAVLILTEGTAKVDNRKYKNTFRTKAKMIPFEDVERLIGHAPGGVCPFGVPDNVDVYLDESLRQFETVYPAAGNDHSAVKLTLAELEQVANAKGWVDVCKII